jgi:hypothetical protein
MVMLYVAQHIDAIIQVSLGAIFTWMSFRPSNKLGARVTKILRVCGPCLIVIGGLLLWKPTAPPHWQRQFTADKMASAEFPGTATPKESTDTIGGISVKRTSFTYNVPGRDIALFLSYSALPDSARGMTDAQRIEGTLAFMAQQGSAVVKNEKDPNRPIYRFTVRQEANKATMQMALAYVGDNVYRVVASWTDGQQDQELTDRFVGSFRVSAAPSN